VTAYLRHGDRIHLAIPAGRDAYGGVCMEQTQKDTQGVRAMYAAQGVEIVTITINSRLSRPAVVAVFRGLPPAGQA
jgi:hypothetical protein